MKKQPAPPIPDEVPEGFETSLDWVIQHNDENIYGEGSYHGITTDDYLRWLEKKVRESLAV